MASKFKEVQKLEKELEIKEQTKQDYDKEFGQKLFDTIKSYCSEKAQEYMKYDYFSYDPKYHSNFGELHFAFYIGGEPDYVLEYSSGYGLLLRNRLIGSNGLFDYSQIQFDSERGYGIELLYALYSHKEEIKKLFLFYDKAHYNAKQKAEEDFEEAHDDYTEAINDKCEIAFKKVVDKLITRPGKFLTWGNKSIYGNKEYDIKEVTKDKVYFNSKPFNYDKKSMDKETFGREICINILQEYADQVEYSEQDDYNPHFCRRWYPHFIKGEMQKLGITFEETGISNLMEFKEFRRNPSRILPSSSYKTEEVEKKMKIVNFVTENIEKFRSLMVADFEKYKNDLHLKD